MLVFIHGIGGRPQHFAPLIQSLGLGNDEYRNLALPGHPAGGEPVFTVDDAALRLSETLESNTVLIGHSTGGVVAAAIAGYVPEKMRGLVIIDSNIPLDAEAIDRKVSRAQIADSRQWRERMRASLEVDFPAGLPDWHRKVFQDFDATSNAGLRDLWRDVLLTDTRQLWSIISVPVLYIQSSRDVHASDFMHVKNVEFASIGCGHWPHISYPHDVAQCIVAWLDTVLPD